VSQPKFEVASGAIDGVNKTFFVSVPYAPNTTAVFLNGAALRKDYANGWVETDSVTGKVDLNEAPIVGDVVQVFFAYTPADGGLDEVGTPRFEVAAGVIDGVNTVFTVSGAYTPDTTAVFLNGIAQVMGYDDGWFETTYTTGVITLKEAPIPGDVVQVFYIYRSAAADADGEAGVCPRLFGTICEVTTMTGVLRDIVSVPGVLRDTVTLYGSL